MTDTSKLNDASCRSFSDPSSPNPRTCEATVPARPLWVTSTPFGRPVDPDV